MPTDPLRSQSLTATLQWLQSKLDALHITRVANITGLDDIGLPVWIAIRPDSTYLTVSQGKAFNDQHAMISAIMESIELLHLENIEQPTTKGSYHDLQQQHQCLSPSHLNHGIAIDPELNHKPLSWVSGTNLFDQSTSLIPIDLINMNMSLPVTTQQYFRQTTIGIAAGNTQTEATIKALLEAIERHTIALWEQGAIEHIEQIINHPPDTPFAKAQTHIELTQKKVHLYYVKNTWDIPVYLCEIIDHDTQRNVGTCMGYGCHTNHAEAMHSALLEAAQTRLTIISGSRDDNYPSFYRNRHIQPPINSDDYPTRDRNTLMDTHGITSPNQGLKHLLKKLREHHINAVIEINHTKASLQIPVSQVIIPGFH